MDELRKANLRRQKDWPSSAQWSVSDWAVEFFGEAGEVCNAVKKFNRLPNHAMRRPDGMLVEGDSREADAIMTELADTVICADLLAMALGRNLGEAIQDKFNAVSIRIGSRARLGEPDVPDYDAKMPTELLRRHSGHCPHCLGNNPDCDFPVTPACGR